MRGLVLAAATLALAACTAPGNRPLATLATGDLTTAQAIAKAAGDTAGAACWGAWLPIASAYQSGAQIGAATAIELGRVVRTELSSPSCAPLTADLVTQLMPLVPGVPLP